MSAGSFAAAVLDASLASPVQRHPAMASIALAARPMLVLGLVLCLLAAAALGADREALPMEGKTGLFQRVLTRPGAVLGEAPGKTPAKGDPLPPLTVLYVYGRQSVGGKDWIEVGAAAKNGVQGWLPAAQAIDWRQTLTVAFARTANREPALFFKDKDSLTNLLESEQLVPETERLRAQIKSGQIPEGFPVIAEEPDTYVDPNRQFYLLPILGFEEAFLESGHNAMLLNVAAVTLQAGEGRCARQRGQASRQGRCGRRPRPRGPRRLPRRGGLRHRHHDLHGSLHRPHPGCRASDLRPAQRLLHGRCPELRSGRLPGQRRGGPGSGLREPGRRDPEGRSGPGRVSLQGRPGARRPRSPARDSTRTPMPGSTMPSRRSTGGATRAATSC